MIIVVTLKFCFKDNSRTIVHLCFVFVTRAQFSEMGTMLEIRDVQYFPDGRSVVDCMGGRRFKVKERGTRDGYNTAKVEFLTDKQPSSEPEKQGRAE